MLLKIADRLNYPTNKKPIEINIEDFSNRLLKKYKPKMKLGLTIYEFFDLTKQSFKVHFDFDKLLKTDIEQETFDISNYKQNIINTIEKIFNVQETNIAISEDHRKKTDYYKVSFHFILNIVTDIKTWKEIQKNLEKVFKHFDIDFDKSIYREGKSKLRTVYSKKDNDNESLMKPVSFNLKKDLHRHLIQITEGLETMDIELIKENIKNLLPEQLELIEQNDKGDFDELTDDLFELENLNEFLNLFKTQTIKKDIENYKWIVGLKDEECPFNTHTGNNNRYLEIDLIKNEVIMKCHSNKCEKYKKVILENYDEGNAEFNPNTFNRLKKYKLMKRYFEKRIIYCNDINKFYQKKYFYNFEEDYYECELENIETGGLKDFTFDEEKDGIITKQVIL